MKRTTGDGEIKGRRIGVLEQGVHGGCMGAERVVVVVRGVEQRLT